MKSKKKLTQQQEFDVMKLVLDKFLWVGFIVMAFGMYTMFKETILAGIAWMVVGAIILVLFMIIIVREYEFIAK